MKSPYPFVADRDEPSIPPAWPEMEREESVEIAARRRRLTRYVGLAVAASMLLCVAAVGRALLSNGEPGGANDRAAASTTLAPSPTAAPPTPVAPAAETPAAAPRDAGAASPPPMTREEKQAAYRACVKHARRGSAHECRAVLR
jgi:hypothetical protein